MPPWDRYASQGEEEQGPWTRHQAAPQVGVVEDVARSLTTGLREGITGIAGVGGDLRDASIAVNRAAVKGVARLFGHDISDDDADAVARIASLSNMAIFPGANPAAPNSEQAGRAVVEAAPEGARDWIDHEPQTTPGEYSRTVGQFASGAVAPGSTTTRVARVVIPALTSETAGQITEGTPLEAPARIVAGVGGGVLTEAGVAARAAQAARRAANPSNAALEQEFGPMTSGERSGSPRARLEEDDLRRDMGSEQARNVLNGFDERRVPEIRRNVTNIATRGQEPLSEDLGSAGVSVSDALRTRVDNMRQQQRALYDRAFELAENEPVSANQVANELLDAVDNVMGREFLDAPGARGVIGRLQNDIRKGRATYGTVERARQALNRQLGTAMKAGDDSAAYAVGRVIDELDAFVAPRLSQEASRAVTEARGLTREMLNAFGQRQRTELSTGHVGRADPGGRAIERVLNTDLTGEQVIESILGGATKPSQQTLGAVRRIRQIHDESINYTNRNAASGDRVPGRRRVGGQTAGQRRFAADADNPSRMGVELPFDELQGLREGLFHRILRPLEGYRRGQMIPAQTMATNLRRALDGPGREITATLFTEGEIARMRRALAYMDALAPPTGAAVSGTSPALARAFSDLMNKLTGLIPFAGPALREAAENATSTSAARNAVKPPRSTPARNAQVDQPTRLGPAAASAAAVNSGTMDERRRSYSR